MGYRRNHSSRAAIIAAFVCILALPGCKSKELEALKVEVDDLSAENAHLRRALEEANSRITTAAEGIQNVQAEVGSPYRALAEAVEEIEVPEEVEVSDVP